MSKYQRWGSHVLFWGMAVLFLSFFLGKESGGISNTLSFVMLLLPIAILTSYSFNYFLFPRYLFEARYFKFTLYSFFVIIVSMYLQMMIVLLTFIFLANYEYKNMIPGTTNVINLGVGMYFVVFLSTLIFLIKRWSKPEDGNRIEEHLKFRVNREQVRVALEEILYVESLDNYVKINTITDQFITKERISELEERLNGRFLRIHRSYLVNKSKIESFNRESLKLNGQQLPISRKYKNEVWDKLNI